MTYEQGKALADELGMIFFETSTYSNVNVKTAIDALAGVIAQNLATNPKHYGAATAAPKVGSEGSKCCLQM